MGAYMIHGNTKHVAGYLRTHGWIFEDRGSVSFWTKHLAVPAGVDGRDLAVLLCGNQRGCEVREYVGSGTRVVWTSATFVAPAKMTRDEARRIISEVSDCVVAEACG